jgi:hypothetical protein
MSSQELKNSEDSDIELDEDDEFFQQFESQRRAELEGELNKSKEYVEGLDKFQKGKFDMCDSAKIFDDCFRNFLQNVIGRYGIDIGEYLKYTKEYAKPGIGTRLNEKIRGGKEPLTRDEETLKFKLMRFSLPMSAFFPNEQYLLVCRKLTYEYDPYVHLKQFSSTSHICLPSVFGTYTNYIYIPRDARILVIDISEFFNLAGALIIEILLTPDQPLELLGTSGDQRNAFWVVKTRESINNNKIFKALYQRHKNIKEIKAMN